MTSRLDPSTDSRPKPGLLAAIEQRKKRGAPISVPYEPITGIELCERIAQGESVKALCQLPEFPTYPTVMRWLAAETDFAARYAHARMVSAEAIEHQILELADQAIDPHDKRVRIDALKWIASKRYPQRYGDKIDVTHSGSLEVRPTIDVTNLSYEDLAVLEKLLSKAKAAPPMPVIEHVPISQIPDTLSDDNAT